MGSMHIGKSKIDKQGRVTLPRTFLNANEIIPGESCVDIIPIINSDDSVRLVFKKTNQSKKKERICQ